VTGALSQARGHVERLEANPEGTLRYARRLADVEAHSVGSSVVRGVREEQEVETKPGVDSTHDRHISTTSATATSTQAGDNTAGSSSPRH
jgi:hypothetical protein